MLHRYLATEQVRPDDPPARLDGVRVPSGIPKPLSEEQVTRINSQPARAHISLTLMALGPRALEVEARSELAGKAEDPALYLAAYQSRLESRIDAGENRGRILRHDYVVLEWQGPFGFSGKTAMSERRKVPLLPGADAAHSGVAAFVQDRRTGEVLQALLRPAC